MVLRLTVNDNDLGPYSSYQIGRSSQLQASLDICEVLAFSTELDNEDADKVEAYLARKWGLTDQSLGSSIC